MARSLISSITKPVSSLISPLLRPAIRFAKHPLAPLGMGVAGAVVENVAEKTGLTSWLTTAGVKGVDYLKSGAEFGITTIAGIADFDGEDKPQAKVEKKSEKTEVAGTPNVLDTANEALHVGCAADKPCAPCEKKKLLAKVAGALEKMSEDEAKAFEKTLVGWSDPPPPPAGAGSGHWVADGANGWSWVPDTNPGPGHWEHRPKGWVWVHDVAKGRPAIPHTSAPAPTTPAAVTAQANAAQTAYQNQINALQQQLQAAKDAVQVQKLQDQISALQAQAAQAATVASNAAGGMSLANLLAQLTQLKAIEEIISPAPTPATALQPVDAYGYPTSAPWGSYQDQDGGILQDPNGMTYGNPDIDPSAVSDVLYPSNTGDPGFDAWANYSVEGVEGSEPIVDEPYAILNDEGECEPCKAGGW